MPTIVTHAVVPLAAALALGPAKIPARIAIAGAALAMLPDLDVIGFRLGILYEDDWGHRGATHSLIFALLVVLVLAAFRCEIRSPVVAAFLFLATTSHGLLDMLTDGGLGVALFWPLETSRHFFSATPIRVSSIGTGFFSARGLDTALSELLWIWVPLAILTLGIRIGRSKQCPSTTS